MLEPKLTPRPPGMTLLELMVVVAVLGILVTVGVPAMTAVLEQNRLKSAAEILASNLQNARWESIKRNVEVYVTFNTDGAGHWCYGVDEASGCDCWSDTACALTTAGAEVRKIVRSDESADITLPQAAFDGVAFIRFNPVRGGANSGAAVLRAPGGKELRVNVSRLGRISLCSPAGSTNVSGYSLC